MKQKKVWRYWCDFCGKGGCGKHAMEVHEKHCTNNPARECRMCGSKGRDYRAIYNTVAGLCQFEPHGGPDAEGALIAGEKALESLSNLVDGCPACMLAVIRQSGMSASGFNFKEARDEWWKTHKSLRAEQEMEEHRQALTAALSTGEL